MHKEDFKEQSDEVKEQTKETIAEEQQDTAQMDTGEDLEEEQSDPKAAKKGGKGKYQKQLSSTPPKIKKDGIAKRGLKSKT